MTMPDPDASTDVTVDAEDLADLKDAAINLIAKVDALTSDPDEGTGTEETDD